MVNNTDAPLLSVDDITNLLLKAQEYEKRQMTLSEPPPSGWTQMLEFMNLAFDEPTSNLKLADGSHTPEPPASGWRPSSEPSPADVDRFAAGLARPLISRARDVVICRQKMVAAMLEMQFHRKRIEDAERFLKCTLCGGVCSKVDDA